MSDDSFPTVNKYILSNSFPKKKAVKENNKRIVNRCRSTYIIHVVCMSLSRK